MGRFDGRKNEKEIHTPLLFGAQGKKNKKAKIEKEIINNTDGKQTPKRRAPADKDVYQIVEKMVVNCQK